MRYLILAGLLALCVHAKSQSSKENPSAEGFNEAGSDPKAILMADEVMAAMGGREAWDQTRYIHWVFFGRRRLLWDKYTGDVRVELLKDSSVILVNINSLQGKVWMGGAEINHPDSLKKYLTLGRSLWINDAYWLLMPFKLKDSGVTLKYSGTGVTQSGEPADILQLTFENVGDTPENRYLVYVDPKTHLVIQWEYFRRASDEKPTISTPWLNYQRCGKILLSGDRGEKRQLTEIKVFEKVDQAAFTSFQPLQLN